MIELFGDYVIAVDPYNYIFGRKTRVKDKDGEERDSYKAIGYCSTLSGALKCARDYFIRQKIGDSQMTLSDAVSTIRRFDDEIKEYFNRVIDGGFYE